MTPSDMLEHIYGLLPDPAIIYEVVFLDLLPPAARDAALQQSSLPAMAAAADKIVREGSSVSQAAPALTSVAAIASSMDDLALDGDVAAVSSRRFIPRRRADDRPRSPRSRGPRFLCANHVRWGKNTYQCTDPASCHMKDMLKTRPDAPPRSSGNARAGRQ